MPGGAEAKGIKAERFGVKPIETIFRQDCLKHVQDEVPWLVFADWLEEDGQLALAAAYRNRRVSNSLGMEMVLVPAGSFWMGGGGGQPGQKQVSIGQDFYLGVYQVTQEQWQALMGANPSYFSRTGGGQQRVANIPEEELKQFPVEQVSWDDAREFIGRFNAREASGEWVYRLPSEEEWEYTCRGGASSKEECNFHFYLDQPSNKLSSTQANFDGKYSVGGAAKGPYLQRTSKVGSYQPNRLGLYDMHGNVWEWTSSEQGLAPGVPGRVLGRPRQLLRGGVPVLVRAGLPQQLRGHPPPRSSVGSSEPERSLKRRSQGGDATQAEPECSLLPAYRSARRSAAGRVVFIGGVQGAEPPWRSASLSGGCPFGLPIRKVRAGNLRPDPTFCFARGPLRCRFLATAPAD